VNVLARLIFVVALAVLLVGAACQPAASTAPTAAPKPAPTEAAKAPPAATSAPAAAPAPTSAPAASGAKNIRIPKPNGDLTVKLGYPSDQSLGTLPGSITNDRLKGEGWKTEDVYFTRPDLNTQALTQGTVQISIAQALEAARVIEKGGAVSWLAENNRGEFVLITKKDIADCKGLDGKRFGIHGETATTSVAAVAYLKNQCGINPQVLVIPGGDNRAVALINDQLDGTIAQVADWLNLDAEAPGKFRLLDTGKLFDISGTQLWVNNDWAAKNPDVAAAYLAETLKTFRIIREEPTVLYDAMRKYLPKTPASQYEPAAKAYMDVVQAWLPDGGAIDPVDTTLKFFTDSGDLKTTPDAKKMINETVRSKAMGLLPPAGAR
jgi:ABC-type nitrate/sulfonate/bicarbonate transport system substrate-binding protein